MACLAAATVTIAIGSPYTEEDMERDTQPHGAQPPEGGQPNEPPFEPDPRLVTYLERGRRNDAETRFREATRDR